MPYRITQQEAEVEQTLLLVVFRASRLPSRIGWHVLHDTVAGGSIKPACVHTPRLLPACAVPLPADVAALQGSNDRGPTQAEGGQCSDERADVEAVCTQVIEH